MNNLHKSLLILTKLPKNIVFFSRSLVSIYTNASILSMYFF